MFVFAHLLIKICTARREVISSKNNSRQQYFFQIQEKLLSKISTCKGFASGGAVQTPRAAESATQAHPTRSSGDPLGDGAWNTEEQSWLRIDLVSSHRHLCLTDHFVRDSTDSSC